MDEINISVTKMITASLETNSTKEVTSQKKVKLKHKKKPPKPPKKKLNRKNEKTSKPSNDLPPIPKETEVLVSNIKSKEDVSDNYYTSLIINKKSDFGNKFVSIMK